MKKFFLLATIASLAFASCDDVPAPYGLFDPTDPNNQGGGGDLPYTNANLKDWSAVSVKGANWDLGNTYAKASGYANGETAETEAWLVSPAISLVSDSSQVHITLDHVIGYVSEASPLSNHTMWIATDYSSDVATATWTQLSYVPKAWATPKDWTFYAADPITIPSEFIGQTVYIAFKFVCGASSTTWEINNLKIVEGGANIGGDTPPTPVEYEHISIADFIAKADANTTYEITGVASKLNANYASLDLTEDGATVYVYKMVDASGANVSFSALDITEGDTVTVTGKYYKYEKDGNVKHELNPGTYVRHKKANGGQVTPPTPSGDAEAISIAEFLSKADVNTVYRLTGTVKNIANTTYGNFDLVDGESSIYIYGLLDKAGAAKNFASLGIKEGDKLTLEGKYVWYVDKDGNGKAEISNAQYISHESGSTGGGNTGGGSGDSGNTGGGNGGNTDVPSGENLIANGDFEAWDGSTPLNWKTTSTAGNATLSQSTDAHGGSYAVKVSGATSNKRIAYKETNFVAGTYVISFYAKSLGGATGQYGPQCRPGYATFNADGTINSNGYKYGDYTNISETDWTLVTFEFTLSADQQICPLMMNPKDCGDILLDDFSLIKK